MTVLAVRAHLRRLAVSRDLPEPTLAHVAGLPEDVLHLLLTTPNASLSPALTRRLVDVSLDIDQLDSTALIGGHGARRRLRALAFMGWPVLDDIEQCRQRHVTVATHRRAIELYDQMAMATGPDHRAHAHATTHAWAGPLDWDEDDIDDLTATPATTTTDPTLVDDVAVDRALHGWAVPLNDAEVTALTARAPATGITSLRALHATSGICRTRMARHKEVVAA